MRKPVVLYLSFTLSASIALAQRPTPGFVSAEYLYGKNSPVKVLQHVRIIDGTGAAVLQDQTVIIDGIRITRIGHDVATPVNAEIFDLTGYTVLPGLVGMHDHIYYLQRPNSNAAGSERPTLLPQMTFSPPRTYLANGLTTIRTSASADPYADINLRPLIARRILIHPHPDPTPPSLQGPT